VSLTSDSNAWVNTRGGRSHPEGGWSSAKSANESHEISEEGDCARNECNDDHVGAAVRHAPPAVIAEAMLHHRVLDHVKDGHCVHLVASQHMDDLHMDVCRTRDSAQYVCVHLCRMQPSRCAMQT